MKRFLEYDPITGITRHVEFDAATGVMTEYATADAQASLDHAARLRNDDEHWNQGVKNDMAHYAHVPAIVLEQWMRLGVNIRNPDALVEMVNKPEWSYLKTTRKYVQARG